LHWLHTYDTTACAIGQNFFDSRARAVVAVWCKPAGVVDLEILGPSKAEKSHNWNMAMYE
jgi:hypothetical protein